MGCDGGTIPRRDELVRTAKKPEQKDKEAEMAFRWRHCALTQNKLQEPIVMCGLGRLYSKQSVIEHLLDKTKTMPESASHIKSLKDIRDLQLTSNPAYNKDAEKFEGAMDVRNAPYICKLIGLEMTGKFRFVALWSCGCVFSERAFKELKSSVCSVCQKPYANDDLIILNGTEEDMEQLRVKMEARVAARKSSKKEKKKMEKQQESKVEDQEKPSTSASSSAGPSTSASSSSSSKAPKRAQKLDKLGDPEFKKAKEDYSVAEDPKASAVYKSLFTTHESEQKQDRAHWVTYNPFYN